MFPQVGDVVLVYDSSLTGDSKTRPGLVTQVWNEQCVNVTILGDGSYDDFETRKYTSLLNQIEDAVDTGPYWYAKVLVG